MTGVRKRERKQRDDRAAQYESEVFHAMCARLGANLHRLRIERGLTLQESANRCGMVMQNYHELEKGRGNPTFTTLARLAEGFAVDVTVLLADANANSSAALAAVMVGTSLTASSTNQSALGPVIAGVVGGSLAQRQGKVSK